MGKKESDFFWRTALCWPWDLSTPPYISFWQGLLFVICDRSKDYCRFVEDCWALHSASLLSHFCERYRQVWETLMRLVHSVPWGFTRNQMTDLIWAFPGTVNMLWSFFWKAGCILLPFPCTRDSFCIILLLYQEKEIFSSRNEEVI